MYDFIHQPVATGEPAAQRFDEVLVPLTAFALRCLKCRIWKRRCACQPEAYEDGYGLVGDRYVAFDVLHAPDNAIESSGESGFQTIRGIWREIG